MQRSDLNHLNRERESNQESSNQGYTDSPIPDSPYQAYVTPRILTPSMRSDSPPPQQHLRRARRGHVERGHRRRQQHWGDIITEEDDSVQIVKGKWGPGRCRPSRRHKRPPPPPPPPAAAASGLVPRSQRTMTIAAHGGRKTLKNRSRNGSRKCKSTRRK